MRAFHGLYKRFASSTNSHANVGRKMVIMVSPKKAPQLHNFAFCLSLSPVFCSEASLEL